MARVEFRNVVKRFGDVEVIPDMNLDHRRTASSSRFSALPAAASRRACSCSPASIFRPPASFCSTVMLSTRSRPGTETSGSFSNPTRSTRT